MKTLEEGLNVVFKYFLILTNMLYKKDFRKLELNSILVKLDAKGQHLKNIFL